MASPTPPPSSAVSPSVPANSSSASPSASSSLSVSSASSSSPFPPLEDPQLLRMLSEPQSTPATGVLSTGASGKKQQSLLSEEAAEALRAAICAAVKLRPANPAQFVSAMLFNKSGFSREEFMEYLEKSRRSEDTSTLEKKEAEQDEMDAEEKT